MIVIWLGDVSLFVESCLGVSLVAKMRAAIDLKPEQEVDEALGVSPIVFKRKNLTPLVILKGAI